MKVRRFIGLLQSESDTDDTEVVISSGCYDYEILSVYAGDGDGKIWIDIQEKIYESDDESR